MDLRVTGAIMPTIARCRYYPDMSGLILIYRPPHLAGAKAETDFASYYERIFMRFTYSLVLIAYNQQDYVRESVRAALGQQCEPLEILLSDDASTDRTFEILQEEAENYSGPHRIRLNRNPENLGVANHVNRVRELAEGDVIIYVAGDDICYPHRAARTIELFEREAPLLAFSHARVERLNGEPAPKKVYENATFYSGFDPRSAALSMQLHLGAACAWHRELYDKYGPIVHENCYEDLILGFRAALEGRLAFIDEELLIYRVGMGLTTQDLDKGRETAGEFRARRLKDLNLELSVLDQRLKDCRTFGLSENDPIVTALHARLRNRTVRRDYVAGRLSGMVAKHIRQPVACLGAIVSENRRKRKALRRRA